MANILITWELGGGVGHLGRWRPWIDHWLAQGHRITLAVRNLSRVHEIYNGVPVHLRQAPFQQGALVHYPQVSHFEQILVNVGFHKVPALTAHCLAWRGLFDDIHPDLVLFDHSPTALLAARGLGFKKIVIGSGFTVPPAQWPFASLRLSDGPDAEAQAATAVEARELLLTSMNQVNEYFGAAKMADVAELYQAQAHWLQTFRELDPYAPHRTTEIYGYLQGNVAGVDPEWPVQGEGRIFVYLAQGSEVAKVLTALGRTGCSVIAYLSGLKREHFGNLPANLHISNDPLNMRKAAAQCDLGVCHGHGVLSDLLLAGKPVLSIPATLEQAVHARQAAELGAGLTCPATRPDQATAMALRLLGEPCFTDQAQAFAAQYSAEDETNGSGVFLEGADKLLANGQN